MKKTSEANDVLYILEIQFDTRMKTYEQHPSVLELFLLTLMQIFQNSRFLRNI